MFSQRKALKVKVMSREDKRLFKITLIYQQIIHSTPSENERNDYLTSFYANAILANVLFLDEDLKKKLTALAQRLPDNDQRYIDGFLTKFDGSPPQENAHKTI